MKNERKNIRKKLMQDWQFSLPSMQKALGLIPETQK
jgi:hypothetical protein